MEKGDNTVQYRSTGKVWIPKPTRHAYINFVQDFRQSYKGAPQTPAQMVVLAAKAWRSMEERERAPYEAIAAMERLKPRPQPTRRRKVDRLQSQVRLLKKQLYGLKTKAKQLQIQGRRRRALRQRPQKNVAPKSKQARQVSKPKRQYKKTHRVVQRTRQAHCQTSCTSVSSSCSSS